ncbi:FecR family protein [Steroidobacter flavus]|uniref:FecR family protein n=1 Tax=Steroidobacter flavus TaxID=1842136 RepID=A0ABV8T4R9_9GAMM
MDSNNDSEKAAAAWLARRIGEGWTAADESSFNAWLQASTRNRVAFIRVNAAWQEAGRLKALGAGLQSGIVPAPGEWQLTPFFDAAPSTAAASIDAPPVRPSSAAPNNANGSGPSRESNGANGQVPSRASNNANGQVPSRTSNGANGLVPSRESNGANGLDSSSVSGDANGLGRSSAKARRSRAPRWQAIAACALLGVLGIAGYLWPTGPSYHTPVGGVARVPISDGSNVTLNTDSRIRVVLTDTERHVDIERGEAFFEVAKDAARPFVVSAGNKRVIAVGTKFSVRRDGEDVYVVVTEGRVRVEDDRAASAPPTQLAAGNVATASTAGVLVQEKPLPEAEEYLSWRSGYLVFRDRALVEAVNEFNRYNTRQLVIDDPSLATLRIGGNFRATNVDGFARLLEQGYPVRIERRDDGAVLLIKAESIDR